MECESRQTSHKPETKITGLSCPVERQVSAKFQGKQLDCETFLYNSNIKETGENEYTPDWREFLELRRFCDRIDESRWPLVNARKPHALRPSLQTHPPSSSATCQTAGIHQENWKQENMANSTLKYEDFDWPNCDFHVVIFESTWEDKKNREIFKKKRWILQEMFEWP